MKQIVHSGDIDGSLVDKIYTRPKLLILCTTGGEMGAALACVDAIERLGIDVCATGSCMSAGLIVLAAGKKRTCTPRTRFMIHPATAELVPNQSYEAIQTDGAEMQYLEEVYAAILGQRTCVPADEWLALGRTTLYFDAKQARKWGLVDEITSTSPPPSRSARQCRRGGEGGKVK